MGEEICEITFLPEGVRARVARGTPLAAAADAADVRIGRHCGGAGLCGKCRVMEGADTPLAPLGETEKKSLSAADIAAGMRLSCCARIVRDGAVTVVDRAESEGQSILEDFSGIIKEWAPDADGFGVSVDIGTTTVVCYLFDMTARRELDRISFLNPQAAFGDDVISRIAYASASGAALSKMRRTLTEELDKSIAVLAERCGVKKSEITEITAAGNTVMEHLFAGVSPESIGRSPYTPNFLLCPPFPAADAGINIAPGGVIKMLPNVAGYVGADIVAGVAALSLEEASGVNLLVDIGTNNEIVAGGRDGLFCCATAAGPAFEGARIEYGMRASAGAVDKIRAENGELKYSTIGGVRPVGICGSGLVAAVTAALREGLIDRAGRFASPEKANGKSLARRLSRNENGMARLLLTDEENPVWLTQKDIREVQLAAGAVKAGTEVMLERAGITKDGISGVYLAGAFGNNMDIESAVAVGLIPDISREKIRGVKNSSGLGASMALASADFYEKTKAVAGKMRYVELSTLPDFQKRFIKALTF